jgi:hypothetical protein
MLSNGRHVRGRISGKRRTSCCVTGLRNLGPLAQPLLLQHSVGGKEKREVQGKNVGNDKVTHNRDVGVNEMDVVVCGGMLDLTACCETDCNCNCSNSDSSDSDCSDRGDCGDCNRNCNSDRDNSNGYELALPNCPPRKFLPSQQ